MRVLQNVGIYPSYSARLARLATVGSSHQAIVDEFRRDGFESCHVLKGALEADPDFFLALGNHAPAQAAWARENGLPRDAEPTDILLAQLEHHRAEVFYNLDPVRFDDRMLTRLPSCVKRTIAWSAAPEPHNRFQRYDLVINNFPDILARYGDMGCRTGYFFPSIAPGMADASPTAERPIDVLFVGGYSRHHMRRNGILEAVGRTAPQVKVAYHLDMGRLNRLAELPLMGLVPSLAVHRRPAAIRAVAGPPLFGRDMQRAFARSKIVLNAAVDMAGIERGNIRCFETLSAGALLLSDSGTYPDEMVPGETLCTYDDAEGVVEQIRRLLDDAGTRIRIASAGQQMLSQRYSKDAQWAAFQALVAGIPSTADALVPA